MTQDSFRKKAMVCTIRPDEKWPPISCKSGKIWVYSANRIRLEGIRDEPFKLGFDNNYYAKSFKKSKFVQNKNPEKMSLIEEESIVGIVKINVNGLEKKLLKLNKLMLRR
jgi:hypothetical protein